MKRLLLLTMLFIMITALFNVSNIYAAAENSHNSNNTLNPSIVLNNTTYVQNDLNIQSSAEDAVNQSADSANDTSTNNLQSTQNTSNLTNNTALNNLNNNTTYVQNSTYAAGDNVYQNVRGIWLKAEDVNILDLDEIKRAGITDIFIKANILTVPTYQTVLTALLNKLKNTNIRVHAWVTCFKDANGNWVDPQGKYSYTVKVPYVVKKYQTKSKEWYKYWYKSKGKWKYKWKYKWVYKWNYQYAYKDEIRTGYDPSRITGLINSITTIAREYNIDGIHLDYIRYPGTAYLNSGGTESITSFVQRVHDSVKNIKPKVAISAALMPETSVNGYYYGQDYAKLAPYLDFLVPMIYKGNYNKNTTWIGTTTKWIVDHSGGKPVLAGLQTYESDDDLTEIPASELRSDVNSAISNGASGYVLFRYGLMDNDFFKDPNDNSITFTLKQIQNAATSVKSFIESNGRLPSTVTISSKLVSMPDFLRLMAASAIELNSGITTPVTLKSVDNPTGPTGNIQSGSINKEEYLNIAQRIKSFIDSDGHAPNYITSSLGNLQYESTIYMYSKVLDFYNTHSRLPSYVSMEPWKDVDPVDMQQYLQQTANCQVNDYRIQALASSLTKGISSTSEKGTKIFNWVRNNLGYSFYYNTKYGAVNTYLNREGNCVDHSHLLVALARAAGIPARYMHGTCTFTSGNVYGHVWTQLYINGNWYDADAISSRNTLGAINNWDKNTVIMKGIYSSLPF
ncbi:transglutaminase domain-containing protein [Methanobacterium sp. ACI-7]|uniref:transglutaminase domain-containing protein n=1 Tax=unclassified Methanobacterium TaxID=2627676 RepID=UPI0039C20AF4